MKTMEFLVVEFSEINDDAVASVEKAAVSKYENLLKSYPTGPINGSVAIRNIGKGADWSVIILTIGGAFFAIPEVHKKVRESFEEWQKIYKELKSLLTWLAPKKTKLYPNQYLFLIALNSVAAENNLNELVFVGFKALPAKDPSLDNFPSLLFSFQNQTEISQVAVERDGLILWKSKISLLP